MQFTQVYRWALPMAASGASVWLAAVGALPLSAQPAPGSNPPIDPGRSPVSIPPRRDPIPANPALYRPQVTAATAAAIDNLRDEIVHEPLTSRMTVAEFLHRAGGEDALVRDLAQSEPVGGPRWLDAQTCQVQLDISGAWASHVLQQIAASSKTSPLTPIEVEKLTADWHRRSFSATGSSTDFNHVAAARPRSANTAWLSILDSDRQRALAAARDDAFAHVLASVRLVPLGRTSTIADALAFPDVHSSIIQWLSQLPVTRVNYRRDLQVELTFAATPDGLYEALRRAVDKHPDFDLPSVDAGWARVRRDLINRMEPAMGRGLASPETAVRAAVPGPAMVGPQVNHVPVETIHIPLGIPHWANDQIGASGAVDAASSKLKAARQAEAIARRKLTEQVEALSLTRTLSIGEAAARDPRIRDAITRAVDRARVDKTDYYHGHDVQVELRLELRDVWDQLRSLP